MMALPATAVFLALVATLLPSTRSRLDRRVVDVAEAGNARSEHDHGYVGDDVSRGVADGRAFRQGRGWMRYALAVFDDTEVTIACTFLGGTTAPLNYELLVEDRVVAARTFTSATSTPTIVEFIVPFAITRAKSSIGVTLRARGGLTPALVQLRTIQDHLEDDESSSNLWQHLPPWSL